ncbi:MAG: hypothetical protein M3Y42_00280 [Actinomycetota bacterium]|nr:hypothetical protein [Actinomycetota bacterium]MDQ2955391.1 hypothetical protein [Actinomycetota bacterium]
MRPIWAVRGPVAALAAAALLTIGLAGCKTSDTAAAHPASVRSATVVTSSSISAHLTTKAAPKLAVPTSTRPVVAPTTSSHPVVAPSSSRPVVVAKPTVHAAPTRPVAAGLCGAPANPFGYNFCSGNVIYSPDPAVCGYFSCIPNFSNGKGYLEQCRDGMYSMSGGRSGACSYHGGENRPVLKR